MTCQQCTLPLLLLGRPKFPAFLSCCRYFVFREGYDKKGYDKSGYDRLGYSKDGK